MSKIPNITTNDKVKLEDAALIYDSATVLLRCKYKAHAALLKCKTREGVIKTFLFDTYNNGLNAPATYYSDTEAIHCVAQRRRSLNDIFLVVKFYIPQAKFYQVVNALMNVFVIGNLRSSLCSHVYRRVYYASSNADIYWQEIEDEFELSRQIGYKNFGQKEKLKNTGKRVGSGSTQRHKTSSGGPLRQHANSEK